MNDEIILKLINSPNLADKELAVHYLGERPDEEIYAFFDKYGTTHNYYPDADYKSEYCVGTERVELDSSFKLAKSEFDIVNHFGRIFLIAVNRCKGFRQI